MAGVKIVDLPALGRDLINTDLLEVSLNGGGSRKITGQEIMNASKLAIGSTPIVSGTVGRLLFQGAGNVLSQPSSLFYDAVNNRLGIGTTTPGASLDVVYESIFQSRIDMYGTLYMYNNITSLSGNIWLSNGYAIGDWGTGNNRIEFYNNRMSFFGNGNEALRIVGSTQNVLIGTTTDAGFKFNVNGTARIQNVLTIQNLTADLYVRTTAWSGQSRIWFGDDSSDTIGGINYEHQFDRMNLRTNAGTRMSIFSTGNVGINTTTDDGFKLDVNGTARVQGNTTIVGTSLSSLTVSNGATTMINTASSGIAGSDFRFRLWTNNQAQTLDLYGSGDYDHQAKHGFRIGNTERLRIFNTGNVLIQNGGTFTDAGFRLDVNGTARVSGQFDVISGTANFRVNNNNTYVQLGIGSTAWVQYNANETYIQSTNIFFQNASSILYASGRGIFGSSSLGNSAQFQIDSTTRGFLPPRMTNAQRAAIASPAVGLIVYCTDATEGLYVYKSTGWTFMV